jgi:hypothetical protein
MSSITYPSIGLHTVRVTKLDLCGVPAWGDDTQQVSDGFVSIQITANYTDIAAKEITNGRGRKCVKRPADAEPDDLTATATFCQVDPALYSAMSGAPEVVDAQTGDVIGFDFDTSVLPSMVRWAMEGWTEAFDVLDCDDPDEIPYGYFVWPSFNGGRVGDYTLEDSAVTFSITDAHTLGGAGWGFGPYLVTRDDAGDPSVLIDALTKFKHERRFRTTVAPPAITDGFVPLDDPEDDPAEAATAGSPGTWDGVRPFDFATLDGSAITATPSTAWTTGQYVVLGDGSFANWDGMTNEWVAGKATP